MRDDAWMPHRRMALQAVVQSATTPRPVPALLQPARAMQYRCMEEAFGASGGIVSADEMVVRLRRRTGQPISQLARWIVNRDVVSFQWQARTMLPLFQFDAHTLGPRPEVASVIRELVPALSDWEIALWFAESNAWLDDQAPVDAIQQDPAAVFDAALAERYLARG